MQFRNECVAELSVPASFIEQYNKFEYPNDATTQCYLKCVFGKFGLFDAQTGFNVPNIFIQLGVTEGSEAATNVKGCIDANEQGSNACEWAYRGATCIIKQNLPLVQQTVAGKA